jgi:hypothetical protein
VFNEFPSVQVAAGQHGRIFVTAHANHAPPFSAVIELCDVNRPSLKEFGTYLNVLFDSFEEMGRAPKLMIVPSAPVVHSADLPQWLSDRCSGSNTPMTTLLQSNFISDKVKSAIWYPLEQMRARNQEANLFPRTWFHWNGPGLESITQDSMKAMFPQVHTTAPHLLMHTSTQVSDVAQMFPGVDLPSSVTEPDYAASKITACHGTTCFPEFKGFEEPLYDASRFHNPAAPNRRLLILSDSFGRYISGWYSRYYRDVEHVAVNNVRTLSVDQVHKLGEFVFREQGNTDILFVFHDGALTGTLRLGLQRFHGKSAADMSELHNPEDYDTLAQQMYVSYLGRPADLAGLRSFRRQLAEAGAPADIQRLNFAYGNIPGIRDVIDSFGKSAEATALYPGNTYAFINAIYRQLFGRTADAGGLRYWAEQVDNGELTRGHAVLAIAAAGLQDRSAQGQRDGQLLSKKVAYATQFTSALARAKRQCYAGAAAADQARKQVTMVDIHTADGQSLTDAARMSDAACH